MLNLLTKLVASVVSGWLGQRAVTAARGALRRRKVASALPGGRSKGTKHLRRYARQQLKHFSKRV